MKQETKTKIVAANQILTLEIQFVAKMQPVILASWWIP
jgi:hypothetical protein